MYPEFHLSIGVKSIPESVDFFENVLQAKETHRDSSGYVNIDFYGTQITLKENPEIDPNLPDLHFGANLTINNFDNLAASILSSNYERIVMKPKVIDSGTPMERKKMYLKCPTGYLVELKGYK